MSTPKWLQIVENIAPIILAATPLAPIAPFVALGIRVAEGIPGATADQKLVIAKSIASVGVQAANAQAGKEVIDTKAADTLVTSGINAVVAATNLRHQEDK